MSHTDTAWTRLAARTARGLLARKGVAYQDLATKLSAMGIAESFRSVESKVQRGSYRLEFFLATLHAVNAEYPSQWKPFLDSDMAWRDVAAHVFLHEVSSHGLDIDALSNRLAQLGVSTDPRALTAHVATGELPFTLLLQLALVAPIVELCRFVDQSDIAAAAGVPPSSDTATARSKKRV